MNSTTESTLNSFLRGEISAVETYRQAIDRLAQTTHPAALIECQQSHERRAEMLRRWIQQHGGQPSEGSGVWGAFAKLVAGGATLFGEKAAIAALEEGEDLGVKDYQREIDGLEPDARQFVQTKIKPEQTHTHDVVRSLKKVL